MGIRVCDYKLSQDGQWALPDDQMGLSFSGTWQHLKSAHKMGCGESVMILTVRYPHVRDLVTHYANKLSEESILLILKNGLNSEKDAEVLSYFIWNMLDEMAKDREAKNVVLSGTDNTSMAPDISYEMDVLMEESGFSAIWQKISDEA